MCNCPSKWQNATSKNFCRKPKYKDITTETNGNTLNIVRGNGVPVMEVNIQQ